ncbi:MAG: SapC family protein [Thermodesulfobacteriota bacterium]
MAEQGIYRNPIFLNSVTHRSVKVAPLTNFSFAAKLNSVVIVGQEFLEAAKFFPVVFTKAANGEVIPMAILGLRNEENLYVDADGNWKEGTYVPAFFRRYPFILASDVGQDGAFAVCVDSAYDGFGKSEGMALFDDKGKQTKEFSRVIEFLRLFQVQHMQAKEMVKLLEEYKLLKDISANITLSEGEKIGFSKLLMVDEQAISNLEDAKIVNLVRTGYLAWIYAHLYSLSNFRPLMALAAGRKAEKKDKKKK